VRAGARGETQAVSARRPTGRRAPAPAELAWGALALAALESRAQRGEMRLLDAEEPSLGRLALPRAGWWPSKARRLRGPTRPRRPSQSKRAAPLQRQAWSRYRSGSRVTRGGHSTSWAPSTMAPQRSSLRSFPIAMPRRGATIATKCWRPSAKRRQRSAGSLTAGAATGRTRWRRRWPTGTRSCGCLYGRRGADITFTLLQAAGGCGRPGSAPDAVFPICISSTNARAASSWRIKNDPSMSSTGNTFRLELRRSC
jgi:hypothetical protein